MRRFWLDVDPKAEAPAVGTEVSITGENFKHVIDVCRQGPGNHFEIIVGDGKAYLVRLEEVGKKDATGTVVEVRTVKPILGPRITLCQSLPRFQKMDTIVEKSVELGVHKIIPFFSDYSFVRRQEKVSQNKLDRWQRISKSATRQCGRAELMEITEVVDFSDLLAGFNQKPRCRGLFLYEGEATVDIRTALKDMKSQPVDEIWVFVGSEGGFSVQEVEEFSKYGLNSITMGSQVLRVETACLAIVSVIKYEFEAMK